MSNFDTLNAINVNGHTEKKNGLTYLSWAWAMAEVKKRFPDAGYCVQRDVDGTSFFRCGTGAEIRIYSWLTKEERDEFLSQPAEIKEILYSSFPIMNNRNQSIPYGEVDSMSYNKNLQRGITKEWAYKGLSLYIYAGEDVPEEEQEDAEREKLLAMFRARYTEQSIAKMEESKGSVDGWSNEDLQKAIKFADMKNKKQMNINSSEETF